MLIQNTAKIVKNMNYMKQAMINMTTNYLHLLPSGGGV